jgi:hypothetical protein
MRDERERRRLEALAAKRYPIDDLELMEELGAGAGGGGSGGGGGRGAADVHQPTWLDAETSQQLADALYIADFVAQFGRGLGIKPVAFADLERLLAGEGDERHGRAGGMVGTINWQFSGPWEKANVWGGRM